MMTRCALWLLPTENIMRDKEPYLHKLARAAAAHIGVTLDDGWRDGLGSMPVESAETEAVKRRFKKGYYLYPVEPCEVVKFEKFVEALVQCR